MGELSDAKPVLARLAEQRERRRLRILAHTEDRMNMILGGLNGGEFRNAPALEGGENPVRTASTQTISESSDSTEAVTAPTEGNASDAEVLTERAASETDDESSDDMVSIRAECPAKHGLYMPRPNATVGMLMGKHSAICFFLGVLLRVLVVAAPLDNVMVPWTVVYVAFAFINAKQLFPFGRPGMNRMLALVLHDSTVARVGFAVAMAWYFVHDTVLVVLAFLLTHIAIQMGNLALLGCDSN